MGSEKAIIVRATDDAVVGWSPGALQLSGYHADEILGRTLPVLVRQNGARATLIGKGGTQVPVTWTRTPVHDEVGRLIAFTDVLSKVEQDGVEQSLPARPIPKQLIGGDDDLTFRQLIESLPLLCWVIRPDGVCEFMSSRWHAFTGVPCEQLVERGWVSVIHRDDIDRVLATLRNPPTGAGAQMPMRIRHQDGSYRWFEARATPRFDERGRLLDWFGASVDVHDAYLTYEALRKEREHLERIIAAAPGAFFSYRWEADGTPSVPPISSAMQALLGHSAESIDAGVTSFTHIHPDDRERVRTCVEESARTLQPWQLDYRVLTRHRGTIWVEARSVPIAEPDGATQWVGFLEDISERKHAEDSLRTAQAQLIAALEAGGMGTSRWSIAGGRMELHASLLTLFGQARSEPDANPDFFEFVLEEDQRDVREALASANHEVTFGYRVRQPDGTLRWLSARGRRERHHVDGAEHITLLHLDVTQQRRATEIQLRSQKLEALGTLAGGIAHDFNNMLHAITGNCALALRQLPEEHPARPMLEAIALASDRAADLVRRLLQFSRPSEQRRDVLKLRDIVRETLKLVRATLPARIEIREELGEHDPYVEVDATQMHQVILNLTANASHAIGEASGYLRVRLDLLDIDTSSPQAPSVARSGRFAALHVTDSGSGMDPATAARIFDPFFTTKEVGQGTGLGLSMVHGIMTNLGGSVSVHTAPGQGSTFTLFFPVSKPPVTHTSAPPPAAAQRAVGRVLFVDDEQILVELGTHTLEALGYDVLAFAHPRSALRAFLDAPDSVDAVLTDLAMPELSGFDLAARLREVRPDLPIVMMSGNVGPDDQARARRLGILDVLIKPVSIDALARALSKALHRATPSAKPS